MEVDQLYYKKYSQIQLFISYLESGNIARGCLGGYCTGGGCTSLDLFARQLSQGHLPYVRIVRRGATVRGVTIWWGEVSISPTKLSLF